MKVLIRTDASIRIGTGHVMRCLTLAGALTKSGHDVEFICRALPGHLCDLIAQRGYSVHRLPDTTLGHAHEANRLAGRWLGASIADDLHDTSRLLGRSSAGCDWLIVDHYWLDASWEEPMRKMTGNIMVIDDLADRIHCCDLLLDTGYFANASERYGHLVPFDCTTLLGPRYLLLRPEFLAARNLQATRDGRIRRIFVFFGGVDRTNETAKTLRALGSLKHHDLEIDVVVGQANPCMNELEYLATNQVNCRLHDNVQDMASLMLRADLAIGAGGTTTWERLYLGLPTLTIMVAGNQILQTESLERERCLENLGWYADVTPESIARKINQLVLDPEYLIAMSTRGLQLTSRTKGPDAVVARMEERSRVCA
ncbi:MAG: UDP-2,4-diacetamido-2,4,6-trideoxy-beta-L-altropyranose hydrolase [Candidatus Zixiibacteriota bacterium]